MMNFRMIRNGKVIEGCVVDRYATTITLSDGTILQLWEGRLPEQMTVAGIDISENFPKVCDHCAVSIFPNIDRDVRPYTLNDGTKNWVASCKSAECLAKHMDGIRKLSRDPKVKHDSSNGGK